MPPVHISEAEAAEDFSKLLARVRAGAEVIIDDDKAALPVMLRLAPEPTFRRLSESLRLARENRSSVTLDPDFSTDLEEVIGSHPEPLKDLWG